MPYDFASAKMITIGYCLVVLASLVAVSRHLSAAQSGSTPDRRLGRRILALGCLAVMGCYTLRLGQAFLTDPRLVILIERLIILAAGACIAIFCFGFHVAARAPLTPGLGEWFDHQWGEPRWDLVGTLAFLGASTGLLVALPTEPAHGALPLVYPPGVQPAAGVLRLPVLVWLLVIAGAASRQLALSHAGRRRVRFGILCTAVWLTVGVLSDLVAGPASPRWWGVGLAVEATLFLSLAVVLRAGSRHNRMVDAIDRFRGEYLMASMDEALVAVDTALVVRAVNRPAEELLGPAGRDCIGQPASAVLDAELWRLASPEEVAGAGRSDEVVRHFATPEGRHRYVASRVLPLADTMGTAVGWVEILHDITEYREAQNRLAEYSQMLEARVAEHSQALAESEARYRGLVEHLANCLVIVQDEIVRFANPAAEALWSGRATTPVGVPVSELWDTGVTGPWQEARAKLAEDPAQPWRGEMVWQVDQEGSRDYLVTASAVQWEGEPAVLLVGVDNTDRRKLQTSLDRVRRLQALGTLTGGIAHDFNNYLTSILGRLSMLQEVTEDDSPARTQVTNALDAAEKARLLISRLMRFSRPEHGGRKPTDLCQLLRDTEPLLDSLIREEIHLEWHLPGEPLWAEVDAAALQEILLNLAKNADDAMSGVSGVLLIAARLGTGADGPVTQILVTDTGPGMGAEVRERLFEPFFTTKPVGQGHGLGLALAHQIMQEHDGQIEVETEPGRGATFILTLPQCAAPPAVPGAGPDLALVEGEGQPVLVVDDDPDVLQTASDMLRRLGYRVLTAANGRLALDVVREEPHIAAILMDIVMPVMNGVDCAAELKAQGFPAPILFMTGYDPDPERLRKLGGESVTIGKPFRLKKLASVLNDRIAAARSAA